MIFDSETGKFVQQSLGMVRLFNNGAGTNIQSHGTIVQQSLVFYILAKSLNSQFHC